MKLKKKTVKKADAKETTAKEQHLGTVDEGLRQGMAGGSRRITLHEHAGQVPNVYQPYPEKQHHNTLRYLKGNEEKKSG